MWMYGWVDGWVGGCMDSSHTGRHELTWNKVTLMTFTKQACVALTSKSVSSSQPGLRALRTSTMRLCSLTKMVWRAPSPTNTLTRWSPVYHSTHRTGQCFCLPVCLSACMHACLSVCLSVCLSLSLSLSSILSLSLSNVLSLSL